jgi:MFS superfamily sulfate permease-like transporter
VLHRIPLHCVGSMLIVAGWQSTPFKEIAKCFKSKKIGNIVIFFICAVSFIILDLYIATIICITLCHISTPKRKEIEKNEG